MSKSAPCVRFSECWTEQQDWQRIIRKACKPQYLLIMMPPKWLNFLLLSVFVWMGWRVLYLLCISILYFFVLYIWGGWALAQAKDLCGGFLFSSPTHCSWQSPCLICSCSGSATRALLPTWSPSTYSSKNNTLQISSRYEAKGWREDENEAIFFKRSYVVHNLVSHRKFLWPRHSRLFMEFIQLYLLQDLQMEVTRQANCSQRPYIPPSGTFLLSHRVEMCTIFLLTQDYDRG